MCPHISIFFWPSCSKTYRAGVTGVCCTNCLCPCDLTNDYHFSRCISSWTRLRMFRQSPFFHKQQAAFNKSTVQFHSSFYDSFGCPFLSRRAANSMHLHLEPYWTQSHLLLLVSYLVAFLPSQPSFLTPTSTALATILGYAQGFSRIIVLSLI